MAKATVPRNELVDSDNRKLLRSLSDVCPFVFNECERKSENCRISGSVPPQDTIQQWADLISGKADHCISKGQGVSMRGWLSRYRFQTRTDYRKESQE